MAQIAAVEARRPVSRSQHKEETRSALLGAAKRLFAERGFEAVTAEEIAAEAGVTERTLFRYFPTKAALVLDEFMAYVPQLLQRIIDRPASEPPYVALLEGYLDFGRANPSMMFLRAGPIWRAPQQQDSGRYWFLFEFQDALAGVLRRRYPKATRAAADVWARTGLATLGVGLSAAFDRQQLQQADGKPIRVRPGPHIRSAFRALELGFESS